MTKDKKVNSVSDQSVRLLIKIEAKGQTAPHNVLVPTSTTQTVQGFMSAMETKFGKEFKFDQVKIKSDCGEYQVDKQYTVGQCFKDFDHVVLQGAKVQAKKHSEVKAPKAEQKSVNKIQKTQEK